MQGIIYPHVSEDTEKGPLPIIAKDGRQPWIEYSRNFKHSDRKPRVAIIINNLGLSATYTEQILKLMPKNITLSFSHIHLFWSTFAPTPAQLKNFSWRLR